MENTVIILLAGFGRNEHSYRRFIKLAPQKIIIHVIPFSEFSLDDTIDTKMVIDVMKQWGTSSAHIVCHSAGGILGIQLAAKKPEVVTSLTLIGSSGVATTRRFLVSRAIIESCMQYPIQKLFDNIPLVRRVLAHPGKSWRTLTYSALTDVQDIAHAVHVPTLILWGKDDLLTPVYQGEQFHKQIENSSFHVLPECEHDWILYKPELFWEYFQKENILQ